MRKKLRFIKWYCGELSPEQLHITKFHIEKGNFYGVARTYGGSKMYPLISQNGIHFDIIDTNGFRQLASSYRIGYKEE